MRSKMNVSCVPSVYRPLAREPFVWIRHSPAAPSFPQMMSEPSTRQRYVSPPLASYHPFSPSRATRAVPSALKNIHSLRPSGRVFNQPVFDVPKAPPPDPLVLESLSYAFWLSLSMLL